MPEHFDDLLSGLATAASHATRPPGPAAARQRGRKRAMHRQIAVPVMSVAVVAAASGIVFAASGHSHGTPTQATHGQHTGSASPAPSLTPGETPSPTQTHTSTPGASSAPVITLTTPGSNVMAAGTLNPVDLTVSNNGPERAFNVSLDLGTPRTATASSFQPTEQAVVQSQDSETGTWSAVRVTTSGHHDIAPFSLTLPHGTFTIHLRIIPVGASPVLVHATLSGAGFSPVTASVSPRLVTPDISGTGPASVSRGSTSGVFTFTLANRTSGSYSGVAVSALSYGSTSDCSASALGSTQWNDDGVWKTASPAADGDFSPLETIGLKPNQTVRIQLRLVVPTTVASCVAKGGVGIGVSSDPSVPFGQTSSSTTATPIFQNRADAPLFAVK